MLAHDAFEHEPYLGQGSLSFDIITTSDGRTSMAAHRHEHMMCHYPGDPDPNNSIVKRGCVLNITAWPVIRKHTSTKHMLAIQEDNPRIIRVKYFSAAGLLYKFLGQDVVLDDAPTQRCSPAQTARPRW